LTAKVQTSDLSLTLWQNVLPAHCVFDTINANDVFFLPAVGSFNDVPMKSVMLFCEYEAFMFFSYQLLDLSLW